MVDDSIRSRLRQYISAVLMCCQYPLFRPCGTYRLRRQSANTCHRHRQIALCSTTSDSECSALSSTASFHNKSSTTLLTLIRALVVSKVDYCCSVLAGVSGHLLDRLCSPSSMLPPDSCSQPALRTHHPTSLQPSLVAGPGTDLIPSLYSGIPMSQRINHISLRAFVGQPMWKVIATTLLPP